MRQHPRRWLLAALDSQRAVRLLWLVNILLTTGAVVEGSGRHGTDAETYLGLADSLLRGTYSLWPTLNPPPPDTFRSPGYPLFLAPFRLFTDSLWPVKIAHGVLHLATVGLLAACARVVSRARSFEALTLAAAALNLQQLAYVPQLFAETLMAFLLAAICWLELRPKATATAAAVRGFLWGFGALVRSVFLYLPLIGLLVDLGRSRLWQRRTMLAALVALATLMPYGLWNQIHHGQFRFTPLEAGGGVFYFGYWHHLIPAYRETRYWTLDFSREFPSLIFGGDRDAQITRFERQWDGIEATCSRHLGPEDRAQLAEMARLKHPLSGYFVTYNTAYTKCRETQLWRAFASNVAERPGYYLANRAWALPRLLFTGLDLDRWSRARSAWERMWVAGPFLWTTTFLGAQLAILVWALRHDRELFRLLEPAVVIILYGWLIHAGVSYQGRYILPVRPLLLLLAAAATDRWLRASIANGGSDDTGTRAA